MKSGKAILSVSVPATVLLALGAGWSARTEPLKKPIYTPGAAGTKEREDAADAYWRTKFSECEPGRIYSSIGRTIHLEMKGIRVVQQPDNVSNSDRLNGVQARMLTSIYGEAFRRYKEPLLVSPIPHDNAYPRFDVPSPPDSLKDVWNAYEPVRRANRLLRGLWGGGADEWEATLEKRKGRWVVKAEGGQLSEQKASNCKVIAHLEKRGSPEEEWQKFKREAEEKARAVWAKTFQPRPCPGREHLYGYDGSTYYQVRTVNYTSKFLEPQWFFNGSRPDDKDDGWRVQVVLDTFGHSTPGPSPDPRGYMVSNITSGKLYLTLVARRTHEGGVEILSPSDEVRPIRPADCSAMQNVFTQD